MLLTGENPVGDQGRKILSGAGEQNALFTGGESKHRFVICPGREPCLHQQNIRRHRVPDLNQATPDVFIEEKTRRTHAACPVSCLNCSGDNRCRKSARLV